MNKKFIILGFLFLFLIGSVLGYSRYNVQYTQPGGVSFDYLSGQGIDLYGNFGSNDRCQSEDGSDFILQIMPFGCTPSVVRSDLLEEQNVPVFCQLAATKINPLIDIEAIKYMDIGFAQGSERPDAVSNIGFHPARAALRSNDNLLNSPILNNVGYAVIVLKQQPVEDEMPDYVEGTLTATLRYDIENAFGIGQSSYVVPVVDDSEWSRDYKKYGFWEGRGFLKVEEIDGDNAIISVYGDEFDRLSRQNLRINDVSNDFSLPGFGCLASVQIRLKSIEDPDTFVRLEVNNEEKELFLGDQFANNKCRVQKIEELGVYQSVTISCDSDEGRKSFELVRSPSINLSLGEEDDTNDFSVGEKVGSNEGENIFLVYVGTRTESGMLDSTSEESLLYAFFYKGKESELSDVKLKSLMNDAKVLLKSEKTSTDIDFVKYGETKKVFEQKIKLIGYAEAQNKFDLTTKDGAFKNALEDYNRIILSYPNEKENEGSLESYGERALFEAIKLSSGVGEKLTMIELCEEFKKNYPNSNKPISDYCDNKELLANSQIDNSVVYLNGNPIKISLKKIVQPSERDYSAQIRISGVDDSITLTKNNQAVLENGDSFILESLDDEKAVIQANIKRIVTSGDKSVESFVQKKLEIKKGESQSVPDTDKTISLLNVNLNQLARIEVIPRIENQESVSNFSFKIGIEKRAIDLSPVEIEKKIENLEISMEKWNKISDSLGSVVKGFKSACLATGTALTVKNFLGSLDGEASARQEVMRGSGGYVDICRKEIEKTDISMDECLLSYDSEIDRDVATLTKIISSSEGVTDENVGDKLEALGDSLSEKYINPDKPDEKISLDENFRNALSQESYDQGYIRLREVRDIERWNSIINDDGASENLKNVARRNLYKNIGSMKSKLGSVGERNTWAGDLDTNPDNIEIIKVEGSQELPYRGLTASQVDLSSVEVNTPVALAQLSDGRKYIFVLDGSSGTKNYPIARDNNNNIEVYDDSGKVVNEVEILDKLEKYHFVRYDSESYNNKFINPEVRYFENDPYKGLPSYVPFDLQKGWYASMKQKLPGSIASAVGMGGVRSYDDSGAVGSFMLCNVGSNGLAQYESGYGDDSCMQFNPATGAVYGTFPGMSESETERLVNDAMRAIEEAGNQYKSGVREVTIRGQTMSVGNPSSSIPDVMCQDHMSPSDCNLLFNVCDPVICPSSRCDLGGTYPVDNVIQSGIIGSVALCLPNFPEVKVPICLSGVKAGIDGLVSIQENYRDCLQENLESGKTIGICDEIHSVYLCEFMWRQSVPVARLAIPKILEAVTGQGSRGGGEYMNIMDAWTNAESSVDYMVNYYGAESYKSFQARSTDEAGTTICKAFASARYPTSGEFFGSLVEPDSPPQYHGWYNEIPFTTATVPATSQYKVFYHIFAGDDQGVYYQVYLKAPEGSSYYYTNPRVVVANDYVRRGEYGSQTLDFTAPTGYKEMCISINGKEECGFQKVSTSFALNYVSDQYIKEQTTKEVNTEQECVSGSPSLYSLAQPNIQEGIDDALNPQLYNSGIVRVCATDSPGKGTDPNDGGENSRWQVVGSCDSGKGNLKCYLDSDSVKDVVNGISIEGDILEDASNKAISVLKQEGEYIENFDGEVKKIKDMETSQEKVNYITEDLIRKSFLGNRKAGLLMLRGDAYGLLAVEQFTKLSSGVISVTEEGDDGGSDGSEKGSDNVKAESEEIEDYVAPNTPVNINSDGNAAVIVIDPGHGGNDPGASGTLNGVIYYEKDLNLALSNDLKNDLENRGYVVHLTRDDDIFMFKKARYDFANNKKADLFISIHHNSAYGQNGERSEVYVACKCPNFVGGNREIEMCLISDCTDYFKEGKDKSIDLANKITENLNNGRRTTQSKGADMTVIVNTNMPSILFEAGFMNNPDDLRYSINKINQDLFVKSIGDAVKEIFPLRDVGSSDDVNYYKFYGESAMKIDVEDFKKLMSYAKNNNVGGGIGETRNCECGDNCNDYAGAILKYSNKMVVDPVLVLSLMMQESSCKELDMNDKGYGGLMQVCVDPEGCGNGVKYVENSDSYDGNIKGGIEELYNFKKALKDTHPMGSNEFCGLTGNKVVCKVEEREGVYYYEFDGCNDLNKYYSGWAAALRAYNGWDCKENPNLDQYTEEVVERYTTLINQLNPVPGVAKENININ